MTDAITKNDSHSFIQSDTTIDNLKHRHQTGEIDMDELEKVNGGLLTLFHAGLTAYALYKAVSR